MSAAADVTDVVIVGSGAGGAPLAARLAEAGVSVVVPSTLLLLDSGATVVVGATVVPELPPELVAPLELPSAVPSSLPFSPHAAGASSRSESKPGNAGRMRTA